MNQNQILIFSLLLCITLFTGLGYIFGRYLKHIYLGLKKQHANLTPKTLIINLILLLIILAGMRYVVMLINSGKISGIITVPLMTIVVLSGGYSQIKGKAIIINSSYVVIYLAIGIYAFFVLGSTIITLFLINEIFHFYRSEALLNMIFSI